MSELIN